VAKRELPHAQLQVVHHELERQLQENLTLQGNLITRALVLVGAAGLSLGLWDYTRPWSWFTTIGIGLAVLAAIAGVSSLWLWRSPSPQLTAEKIPDRLAADEYSVLHSVVTDLAGTIKHRAHDVKRKGRWITIGFVLMSVGWVSLALGLFFN
jgi:hypothetical protein